MLVAPGRGGAKLIWDATQVDDDKFNYGQHDFYSLPKGPQAATKANSGLSVLT